CNQIAPPHGRGVAHQQLWGPAHCSHKACIRTCCATPAGSNLPMTAMTRERYSYLYACGSQNGRRPGGSCGCPLTETIAGSHSVPAAKNCLMVFDTARPHSCGSLRVTLDKQTKSDRERLTDQQANDGR